MKSSSAKAAGAGRSAAETACLRSALGYFLVLLAFSMALSPAVRAGVPGELRLEPLLVAPRSDPQSQLLRLRFEKESPEPPFDVEIAPAGGPPRKVTVHEEDPLAGGFVVAVPVGRVKTAVEIAASGRGWERRETIELRPLRPWRLFLVQHTHTDIGYTGLPSRLNVDHLGFLDEAVRACALTDDYPDDARFRWTCEGTWAVERYLRERPREQVDAFLRRVREGRIEVTAMRMNMTDLAHEELVVRNMLPVNRLRRLGIPVRTAMQCDVNGYPWALPELLDEAGVEGFVGAINHTRSTLPFAYPQAIDWRSPSGGRVVAWRGEHYMFANMIGFRESVRRVLDRLPGYLRLLEKKGYPYSIALLQMAGYFTDNAAPCHRASDLVREWNERFAVPSVRLATLGEWFEALRRFAEKPPVYQLAWPDWWADGVGSAPLETAIIRRAQEDLGFAETFLSLGRALRPESPDRRAAFEEAYLFACLYDEHTFGASESISRPDSINTRSQWREKASNAYRARWLATELEDAVYAEWGPSAVPVRSFGIVVFNSLPWERTGPVTAEIPRGIADEGTPFRIVDPEAGEEIPYQFTGATRNFRRIEFVARRVPQIGYRTYSLRVGEEPAAFDDPLKLEGNELSNGLIRVVVDPSRAAVGSISVGGGPNAVDPHRTFAFNQLIHERIVHEKGRRYLWPAAPEYSAEAFERLAATDAELEVGLDGPVKKSLRMTATLRVPGRRPAAELEVKVRAEISLYREVPAVFIEDTLELPGTEEPTASYFAFPFAGGGPPRAEVVGGVLVPGRDQIPGSAADWHAVQRWVRVPGAGGGAVWVAVDAPLVQFGGLNVGRWTKGLTLDEPVFYSWVANNYWFTNFVARQRGEFRFRYAVSAGKPGASDEAAHRFARGVCSPLRAFVTAGRGPEDAPAAVSLVEIEPECVDLVALKEAEGPARALVFRLRNRSPRTVVADLKLHSMFRVRRAAAATILEEVRAPLAVRDGIISLELAPWRVATVLADLEASSKP